MDVTLEPGEGHDFHRHPGQEEMIIVKQGRITQYIEQESTTLGAGDSVYLDEGVIHASFNDGDETAHLQVVIGPSLGGETGYGLEDVSAEEPWASAARLAARRREQRRRLSIPRIEASTSSIGWKAGSRPAGAAQRCRDLDEAPGVAARVRVRAGRRALRRPSGRRAPRAASGWTML